VIRRVASNPFHPRHPDVRHHDVRSLTFDQGNGLDPTVRLADNLEVGRRAEQHRQATADQRLVVGQRRPDHDGSP